MSEKTDVYGMINAGLQTLHAIATDPMVDAGTRLKAAESLAGYAWQIENEMRRRNPVHDNLLGGFTLVRE